MLANTYFPFVFECGYATQRSTYRFLDWFAAWRKGYESGTCCTNIQQYVNLYAGPKYSMHYKYSAIMNIVFITMMFGVGLPILFPLASVSLMFMYFLEKYEIYYVFQQPPAYDEKLNDSVLSNLDKAPVFLLSFGYWFLTNLQLLSNDFLEPIMTQTDAFQSHHVWSDYLNVSNAYKSGPAGSLLIMLYLYLAYLVFRVPIIAIFKTCFPNMSLEDLCIDEKIDLYQNCLDQDDKDFTLKEEENSLLFGIRTMMSSTKKDIDEA